MGDAVSVTVAVCAYTMRRADDIVAALTSALAQIRPGDDVLLVSDHSEDVAEHVRRAVPNVRVVMSTGRKGLSGARNTAIAEARGDVLVFLDDDAAGSDGWLQALRAPYADPAVAAVGGAADPRFPRGVRPAHLPHELDWVVGCTYTGQPTSTSPVRNMMGCNMSARRALFDVVGGFNEDIGRIGRTPLGCEETEWCIRLTQCKPESRILFEPSARVRHTVSADRVRFGYLVRRGWAEGLSKAHVASLVGEAAATSAERAYSTTVLPQAIGRELRASLTSPRHLAAVAGIIATFTATVAGYVRGRLARR